MSKPSKFEFRTPRCGDHTAEAINGCTVVRSIAEPARSFILDKPADELTLMAATSAFYQGLSQGLVDGRDDCRNTLMTALGLPQLKELVAVLNRVDVLESRVGE